MSSSSSFPSVPRSFYAAFLADDTPIQIIPSFDLPLAIPVISGCGDHGGGSGNNKGGRTTRTLTIGPFQAGMTTTVPLWCALHLHQRSLLRLLLWPAWCNVTNLTEILRLEKQNPSSLYGAIERSEQENQQSSAKHNDDEDENNEDVFSMRKRKDPQQDEITRLPRNYYEVGKRLLSAVTKGIGDDGAAFAADIVTGGGSNNNNSKALAILLEDLLELRVDKLRQQFQSILVMDNSTDAAVLTELPVVAATGIGTQELALLYDFVTQALNDRHALLRNNTATAASSNNNNNNNSVLEEASTALAAATNRRKDTANLRDDDNDIHDETMAAHENEDGDSNDAAVVVPKPVTAARRPLRRRYQ